MSDKFWLRYCIVALVLNVSVLAKHVFLGATWWRVLVDLFFIGLCIFWIEHYQKRVKS